jgi:lipopolysaccharide/colanic/teichoic acid biosynthesis glycosyltransferase
MKKTVFDILIALLTAVAWIPVLLLCCAGIWLLEGRPIFYASPRRVFGRRTIRLFKMRTMVRNAERIANRATVPIDGTRFLNIPLDSSLYTKIGRFIERFHFTELPQLAHVLRGEMSVVGNRPLPENVVAALRELYPSAEDRFRVPCGLTGPTQLVGREELADGQRLMLEIAYCEACRRSYSARLDLLILWYTVLVALDLRPSFTVSEVMALMRRYSGDLAPYDAAPRARPIAVPEREADTLASGAESAAGV